MKLGLDFETFYDTGYTLSGMTTAEYVMCSKFEIIGVGLVLGGVLPAWYSGSHDKLREILSRIPWETTEVIAHNAMFDGAILEWILGFKPKRYMCTMMGSRPYCAPVTGSASLATCAEYFQLSTPKGTAVHNFRGWRRESFSPAALAEYGEYCKNDAMLSCELAEKLAPRLPDDEWDLIDLTIKKFTRPKLKIDRVAIDARLEAISRERSAVKTALLEKGVTVETLRSRPKFAALLESHGVAAPMKLSAATGQETFAMSKQDAPFLELLGHGDPWVRQLVNARFLFASNMEETRLRRIGEVYDSNVGGEHLLPVPLLYYGAHTGRFSGLDKINLQNLPRVDAKRPVETGWLRRAIIAPEGYKIVAADLSNIEARITATLAGQWDLVEAFRTGSDVYSQFATRIYGRPVNKKDHPAERFVGKTCILGLGYGMGQIKFHKQMVLAGRTDIDERMAQRIVWLYREAYPKIPALWAALEHNVTRYCLDPAGMYVDGPLTFLHERIVLPNGMPIIYNKLRATSGPRGSSISTAQIRARGLVYSPGKYDEAEIGLWGGAITENVGQALARIVLTTAELRLARAGLPAAHQVHDELVYCVRNEHVDRVKLAIAKALSAPVDWMPRLPVTCEIGVGQSYAEAK